MHKLRFSRGLAVVTLAVALAACGRTDPAAFIASAKTYMGKADYPAAIIELKNALKDAPENGEARFLLAQALLETGNPVAAETEARKALELKFSPDDSYALLARSLMRQGEYKKLIAEMADRPLAGPAARAEVLTAQGLAYLGLGQRNEAREAITAALAVQPKNVNARVARALVTATDNDVPGALKMLDAVLADAPNDVDGLLLKADLEGSLGHREDAIKTLERVVAVRADSLPARGSLVSNYVATGMADKAAPHLEVMKKIAPRDPRTLQAEALVAYAAGNYQAARDAIEKSVQAAPDYIPSRYLSGLVYYQLGNYAAAEDALRVVLAKMPGNDGVRRVLAATYLKRGRASQALETLEPVMRRAPNDPVVLRTMGETQFALNNPARAALYFERANAIDKGTTESKVRLAQVRLSMGDANRAMTELEALSTAEPTRQEPDLALISAHLRRREYDKALAAAANFEAKQPKNPAGPNAKGVVYLAKRDPANARASFEKALAIDPDYATASFNLARLDMSQRNFDGARKRYEQMLAKDPKNETALLAIAEILALTKAPPADIKAALGRAIDANPTSLRPRLALISYNGQLRDWNAALAAAQAAQTALPGDPQVVEALGAAQLAAGETNQALASFRKSVEMQPENPAPLLRLADAQMRSKDFDGAIASLRGAIALQPDNPRVWVALGALYAETGRLEAGLAEAKKMQKERPDAAFGFALEGELVSRKGQWPETIAAYRAAAARQQSDFLVGRLHSALMAGGKTEEAAALVQKYLKEHPNDVLLRMQLAQRSLLIKDNRAAAQLLLPAAEIEPDNVTLLNNLAWALNETGDARAVEYAERAYSLAPTNAATADTYGWILVKRGDVAQGTDLLRKAVELSPADADIRLRLAQALLKAGDKAAARKELDIVASPQSAAPLRAEAEKLLKTL